MNSEIKILKLSEGNFLALAPLLEKKKPNTIILNIERYLIRNGYTKFSRPSFCEVKKGNSWFSEFRFKISEPEPKLVIKKAIEFALNQALKE